MSWTNYFREVIYIIIRFIEENKVTGHTGVFHIKSRAGWLAVWKSIAEKSCFALSFIKFELEPENKFPLSHVSPQLTRMNYFLVQLSVADVLTTLLTLLPEIGSKQTNKLV